MPAVKLPDSQNFEKNSQKCFLTLAPPESPVEGVGQLTIT
jgi:hypothetical protein